MEQLIEAIKEKKSLTDFFTENPNLNLKKLQNATEDELPSEKIPLHVAVLSDNKEALEILLEKGANINVTNRNNHSALEALIEAENENIPMLQLLVEKGADIDSGLSLAVLQTYDYDKWELRANGEEYKQDTSKHRNKFATIRFLISKNPKIDSLKEDPRRGYDDPDNRHTGTDLYRVLKAKADVDIVQYFLKNPKQSLGELSGYIITRSGQQTSSGGGLKICFEQYHYKLLQELMKKKLWESAMKLLLLLEMSDEPDRGPIRKYKPYDNKYPIEGVEEYKEGIFETIMSNVSNLNYEDEYGNKAIHMVFDIYLRLLENGDIDVGLCKRLLEFGADQRVINYKLGNHISGWGYKVWNEQFSIDFVKKLLTIGADLKAEVTVQSQCNGFGNFEKDWNGSPLTTIVLGDKVFLGAACLGNRELVEMMIEKGVDLFLNFDNPYIFNREAQRFENQPYKPTEEIQLLITQEIMKRELMLEKRINHPKEESGKVSVMEYFLITGQRNILDKLGFLPPPPENLKVAHAGLTCSIAWSLVTGSEQYPVTGYQVEKMVAKVGSEDNISWQEVSNLVGQHQTRLDLSGLKSGTQLKFRVLAENENGFSKATEQPEIHTVTVVPLPPSRPATTKINADKDLVVTWSEPELGNYAAITKYKVEGRDKEGQWKLLGRISSEFGLEMKFFDYKSLAVDQVRIVAVNLNGESPPGDASECF